MLIMKMKPPKNVKIISTYYVGVEPNFTWIDQMN